MSQFFGLSFSEDKEEIYGVAYAPEESPLLLLPRSGEPVKCWEPLRFTLRDGTFSDYQANDAGVRLCSEKMKDVIEESRTEEDCIQWLQVLLGGESNDERIYYLLHFPVDFDILDRKQTVYADDDFIVKPVFDGLALQSHAIVTLPHSYGIQVYASEELKSMIEKAACTDVSFSKVPMT